MKTLLFLTPVIYLVGAVSMALIVLALGAPLLVACLAGLIWPYLALGIFWIPITDLFGGG